MSRTRQNILASLRDNDQFDVIVVGGGVNGIGVYRELSLQGLRVLLVERNDYASGCSAAPSRMIHGGLRYLENGEFDLVRESLHERDALLRNAPHMVRPLATVIPITSVFSGMLNAAASFFGKSGKPSSRGVLPIRVGLYLYDWVTRKRRALPRHHFNNGRATRQTWPALTTEANYSAVYYDAWISHPERLCIEMLKDMETDAPESVALNYAELAVNADGAMLTCGRTGARIGLRTQAIVHATGAWLDASVAALGDAPAAQMVSGTKGSHLIIDHPELEAALNGHMAYFENADGRVCIAFPFQGHVLAGSTDIRVTAPGRVRCEDDELTYILDSLRLVFPEIAVGPEDVVFSFSGIRPLPQSAEDFTGRISRGHVTKRLPGKTLQFAMVGGKWTTFRAFAEQTADAVMQALNHSRRCDTVDLPIGGGKGYPETGGALEQSLIRDFGVGPERAAHLASHYGTDARQIQRACMTTIDESYLGEGSHYTAAEIQQLIRSEQVQTLSDIVLRRTALAITGAISDGLIARLSDLLATELDLSPQDIARQQRQLVEELSDYYGVTPDILTKRTQIRSKQCA